MTRYMGATLACALTVGAFLHIASPGNINGATFWLIGITCVLILWGAGVFEKRGRVCDGRGS